MNITALDTYSLSAPLPQPVRTPTHTLQKLKAAARIPMAELYQVPIAAHHDPQIHVHAVAASPTGFILESFADETRDPLWFELFRERPEIVDGAMAVPDAPGLGLVLRDDTLEKYGLKLG